MNTRDTTSELRKSLREQFEHALQGSQAGKSALVDLTAQNHAIITDILYDFVYCDTIQQIHANSIQMAYADGSKGGYFPLRCLVHRSSSLVTAVHTMQPLRVALISMRHLEMDTYVDMAWLLNKAVAEQGNMAEVEEYSYSQTRKQLADGTRIKPLRLFLYQTGFPPAVVGFYRALVEELLHTPTGSAKLEVMPCYFMRPMGCYHVGKLWN